MREDKFFEKVKDILIFKTTEDKFVTEAEYLASVSEKHANSIYYVNDVKQQSQYIRMFKEHGMEAVVLDTMIDSHFISFMENHNHTVKFLRIDSDITNSMKHDDAPGEEVKKLHTEKLEKAFREATGNSGLKVTVESLKSEGTPAIVLLSEQSRRLKEMSRSFGGGMDMKDLFPNEETLVLNLRNPLIIKLMDIIGVSGREEDVTLTAQHIHDLAMLGHRPLDGEAMANFIERSNRILAKLL